MPEQAAATWHRIRGPLGRFGLEVLPIVPFALVLALALGFTVWVGAELAHAYPSEAAPNGWQGPANFDAGVSTLRPQLVLAATIPAILIGLMSTRRFKIGLTSPVRAGLLLVSDLALIALASWLGAIVAREGVAKTSNDAFWAFVGAHALLAASFYALAVLSSVAIRKMPALVVGVAATAYLAIYDSFLRAKALRELGLAGLRAAALPAWFYAAQAASPISLYRALLIVWHKGFMDYEERAVLSGAALPPWMTIETLAMLLLVLWVLVPLEVAWIVWTLRYNRDRKMIPVRNSAFAPPRPASRGVLPHFRSGTATANVKQRARAAWSGLATIVTGRQEGQTPAKDSEPPRPRVPPERKLL